MTMKVKTRNILLILILAVIIVGFFGYNYLYQDHRDIQAEEAVSVISANDLLDLFVEDPSHEYLNQTIVVNGVISEMESTAIVLNGKVHCTLLETDPTLKLGSLINVKGRCLGYDELFEIVKLDQCSLQNQ